MSKSIFQTAVEVRLEVKVKPEDVDGLMNGIKEVTDKFNLIHGKLECSSLKVQDLIASEQK